MPQEPFPVLQNDYRRPLGETNYKGVCTLFPNRNVLDSDNPNHEKES